VYGMIRPARRHFRDRKCAKPWTPRGLLATVCARNGGGPRSNCDHSVVRLIIDGHVAGGSNAEVGRGGSIARVNELAFVNCCNNFAELPFLKALFKVLPAGV
jgi:hypothetical protein